jgi:hypothetical protein
MRRFLYTPRYRLCLDIYSKNSVSKKSQNSLHFGTKEVADGEAVKDLLFFFFLFFCDLQ